jgi:hypothetical protein
VLNCPLKAGFIRQEVGILLGMGCHEGIKVSRKRRPGKPKTNISYHFVMVS